MENNLPNSQNQPTNPTKTSGINIIWSIILLSLFSAVSFLAYNNYLLSKNLEKLVSQQPTPAPSPMIATEAILTATPAMPVTTTPTVTNTDQWQMAKYGGVFSYMYPTGWHVAELWPEASGGPIRIAMDPKPITTAPMGGPSSSFNINFYNGLPKPDAKLADLKAELKPEYFTEIKTETIDSINGPIFYHSGKMSGEYMNGTKVETYLFTVKKSASDPQNVQVMQAVLYGGDQKQSDMLRYIVLSFKSL